MRNRIAKNAEANRWVEIARDLRPLLKIGQCVTLGSLHILRLDDIENTPLAAERECPCLGIADVSRAGEAVPASRTFSRAQIVEKQLD